MDSLQPAKATLCWAVLLLLQLLLATTSAEAAHTYGKPSRYLNPDQEDLQPQFEETPTDIQALVGQTVILPCNIIDLGDKVVSWIRTRDLHILTSDLFTFTSDDRFGVLHTPASRAWNLRIMGAKQADEGKYECQVNTDPKMNRAVFLKIRGNEWLEDRPYGPHDPGGSDKAPAGLPILRQAKVLGAAEQFVSLGSTVTFTCLVAAPYPRGSPPHTVVWLHRNRVVSIQAERGGISMATVTTESQTTSRLTVAHVGPADAGNYTCAPGSGIVPATVALVVTDGERTEAMQRDGLHSGAAPIARVAALLLLLAALASSSWRQTT
ncbi:hypothetical protein R5R35_005256 [Gryllus longicercus]|uniref:Ig-like domain-containing protein n=1 Tax=Gryllus longicercus TaxID=2509291 RepID=A0AAN9VNV5_9ORTH